MIFLHAPIVWQVVGCRQPAKVFLFTTLIRGATVGADVGFSQYSCLISLKERTERDIHTGREANGKKRGESGGGEGVCLIVNFV